jgi:DNA-binding Lrp family transcriptional regulator
MDDSLTLKILQMLRVNAEVPIEYLMSRLGSSRSEIERRIDNLEHQRIVRRRADMVRLETTHSSYG